MDELRDDSDLSSEEESETEKAIAKLRSSRQVIYSSDEDEEEESEGDNIKIFSWFHFLCNACCIVELKGMTYCGSLWFSCDFSAFQCLV